MTRKETLFDKYSKNLEIYKPLINGLPELIRNQPAYVCPLCFRAFTKEGIDALTLDHVPPRSVDGNFVILTCQRCNNKTGSEVESKYTKIHQGNSFAAMSDKSQHEAIIKINDLKFKANVTVHQDGSVLEVQPKFGKKDQRKLRFDQLMKEKDTQKSLEFSFAIPHGKYEAIADLKFAYLIAFVFLGYGFIWNPKLQAIRDWVLKPRSSEIPAFPKIPLRDDHPEGVFIVHQPVDIASLLIAFKATTNKKRTTGVLLPLRDQECESFYKKLAEKYATAIARREIQIQYYDITTGFDFINDTNRRVIDLHGLVQALNDPTNGIVQLPKL